jgi:hypothetical protein
MGNEMRKEGGGSRREGGGKDPPELLDEDRDAGPCAQAQRPFDSAADGQPATDVVDGDVPAEQKQRVQRDLR